MGRFTLQGALRYDHAWSYFPEQTVDRVAVLPDGAGVPATRPASRGITICGRAAASPSTCSAHGKTSVKVNFGRYLEAAQNGGTFIALNPTGRLSTTTTRAWTDNDKDWVADCNLNNPALQNPATTGSVDVCGANAITEFRDAGV